MTDLIRHLDQALEARSGLIDENHTSAFRVFNGFYEGCPELVADIYARTLILFGYGDSPPQAEKLLNRAQTHLLEELPWITCVIQKFRHHSDSARRRGVITHGESPATKIREHGIWYALDVQMQQDASFYLDTRNLRKWLLDNAAGPVLSTVEGWRVLNTFAYTGSLGVAALAGGAVRVIQGDRNRKFLALARQSGMLNHLDIGKMKLQAGDFFSQIAQLKRSRELFDCVIVDPPFFSATKKGTVNLSSESTRLINKVRPLVRDGGYLVSINNALFLSGAEYMQAIESLCADGYLAIETLISVPKDITGYPQTVVDSPPYNPAPFNHPTKIVILRVRRKT